MTDESRRENVVAEVEKGRNSLRAARELLRLGLPDDSVARAYYSVLHVAAAVLLTEGLEARSHAGIEHLLSLHLVRPGRLDGTHVKALMRLMQFRLQADCYSGKKAVDHRARGPLENA